LKPGLVLILGAAFFSWASVNYVIGTLVPSIQRDLALSPITVGLIASSFGWSYALMQLPVGLLSDRKEPRILVYLSMLGLFASAVLFALSTTGVLLIVARIGIGIASSFIFVVGLKAIEFYYERGDRGKAQGIFLSSNSLGLISAGALGPFLLSELGFSWQMVIASVSVIALITGLSALLFFPRRLIHQNDKGPARIGYALGEVGVLMRNRFYWIQNLVSFVSVGTTMSLIFWIPSFFVAEGLGLTLGGAALSLVGIGALFGNTFGGWLTDRTRRKPLLIYSLIVNAAAILVMVAEPKSALALLGASFVLGASSGGQIANTRLMIELFPRVMAGVALGLNNSLKFVGLALYSFLIGVLVQAGYGYPEAFVPLLGSFAIAVFASLFAIETRAQP
jgi:predicted MFS family arabinose efflux permease